MPYTLNHVHLKALDPEKAANWWVNAFNFEIVADMTRHTGDRFIRCRAGEWRAGEYLGSAWTVRAAGE